MAREFDFYPLEERVLLSGEGLDGADLPDVGDGQILETLLAEVAAADGQAVYTEQQPANLTSFVGELLEHTENENLVWDPAMVDPSQSIEVVFVDEGVNEISTLLDDLATNNSETQWLVIGLNSDADGLSRITETLQQVANVEAIHIISHGDGQGIQLGNARLDMDTAAGRAGEIASWALAFNDETDILIYGCDLASTCRRPDTN